ncbi:MAG: threonine--tRNA ligase [Candidatus Woesearchaeota archaeon]
MKILAIHADFIEFEAKKKAIKDAEDAKEGKQRVEECLVIFSAVEKADESDLKGVVERYVKEVKDIAVQVKAKNIVLYPYAHLSSSLAAPKKAEEALKEAEKILNKEKEYQITRAPFGWYKSFNVACKGHPLSELSRSFGPAGEVSVGKEVKIAPTEEVIDHKKLLAQISKSRLDTSKLKDNDHRIIGQKLDLFSFQDVAPGMVFYHDKGLTIYNELVNFWREEHRKAGYQEISTPQILDKKLWLISGHWDKYKENIFLTDYEKREFAVKPMNCPGGMLVYKSTPKTYRHLPLRVGELGIVHRQELSGVLAGLFRVIKFTQDDAHIFCTEEQLDQEINNIIELIKKFFSKFNLEFDHVELSTRPEKRIGDDSVWDKAEKALEDVLKKTKMKYKVNEGDGAFYGPKIDFHVRDSLGRTWQCSTIQLDFAMPERFELEYVDNNNQMKRPVMLHRVIYGSLERFIGILLEHTNGNLPLWLNPVQVKILTVNERNNLLAQDLFERLMDKRIRVELDLSSETIGKKVRDAQMEKSNYMVTIGDKEVEKNCLAIRSRSGEVKFDVKIEDFIKQLVDERDNRK